MWVPRRITCWRHRDLNYGNPQTCIDINNVPGQSCGTFSSDNYYSFNVPAGMTFHMPYIPGLERKWPEHPLPGWAIALTLRGCTDCRRLWCWHASYVCRAATIFFAELQSLHGWRLPGRWHGSVQQYIQGRHRCQFQLQRPAGFRREKLFTRLAVPGFLYLQQGH